MNPLNVYILSLRSLLNKHLYYKLFVFISSKDGPLNYPYQMHSVMTIAETPQRFPQYPSTPVYLLFFFTSHLYPSVLSSQDLVHLSMSSLLFAGRKFMKGNRLHITLANRNVSKHFDNVHKIQFNFMIDGLFQIYLSNGLNFSTSTRRQTICPQNFYHFTIVLKVYLW